MSAAASRHEGQSPHYHVVAGLEGCEDKLHAIFVDLTEAALKARLLVPYANGTDLVSGNQIVPVTKLRKLHIIHTERNSRSELDELQRKSREDNDRWNRESSHVFILSLGLGYKDEDIIYAGTDATAAMISAPPGSATSEGILSTTKLQERKARERLYAFVFGVAFAIVMMAVAVFIPEPRPFQY